MGKGLETRQRILEGALKLASSSGLEQLTIGSLASALSLSKSGLFAHFRSKENLQLEVLNSAAERFEQEVVVPAIQEPRGEPRLVALFENWLDWGETDGGCIFVAATAEFDDKPGQVRDRLVALQTAWIAALGKATRLAMEVGHLRSNLDPDQFAFELYALMLGSHHHLRLLRDPAAQARARVAFERLLHFARRSDTSP